MWYWWRWWCWWWWCWWRWCWWRCWWWCWWWLMLMSKSCPLVLNPTPVLHKEHNSDNYDWRWLWWPSHYDFILWSHDSHSSWWAMFICAQKRLLNPIPVHNCASILRTMIMIPMLYSYSSSSWWRAMCTRAPVPSPLLSPTPVQHLVHHWHAQFADDRTFLWFKQIN